MSQGTAASPAAAPPAAKTGSVIRLAILIALLLGAIGMWYYDYSYAGPRSNKAHEDIEKYVATRNEEGVSKTKGGVIRREEIKDLVGFAPTYTTKHKDHDVEYYCWWGPIPGLNTYKRFITVVYVGPEPRRYQTHHLNESPPEELLPGYVPPSSPNSVEDAPVAGTPSGEADSDSGEKGGKKGRGRGAEAGEGDTPSTDTPGEGTTTSEGDKPAESPKEGGEKPAAETDKPATPGESPKDEADKPAAAVTEEKPAGEPSESKP